MTYTNKTQPTKISPEKYLQENFKRKEKVQSEALVLVDFYTKITGFECVMWNKIFGFDKYFYKDSKGGEHEFLMTGFTISSTGFTLYNIMGWENYATDLKKLGKYKLSGISCLAIKSTEDINLDVLKIIIKQSIIDMKKKYKIEI